MCPRDFELLIATLEGLRTDLQELVAEFRSYRDGLGRSPVSAQSPGLDCLPNTQKGISTVVPGLSPKFQQQGKRR